VAELVDAGGADKQARVLLLRLKKRFNDGSNPSLTSNPHSLGNAGFKFYEYFF